MYYRLHYRPMPPTAAGRSACGILPLAALAALATLASGCGDAGKSLTPIQNWTEFQQKVLKSDRPVLVEFNKDPCPTCEWQKADLDKVAPEFNDRVFFASMTIMKGFFVVTAPEVRDQYHLGLVPTTILFIKGEEKKRWTGNHGADEIRAELTKFVGEPRPPKTAALPAVGAPG